MHRCSLSLSLPSSSSFVCRRFFFSSAAHCTLTRYVTSGGGSRSLVYLLPWYEALRGGLAVVLASTKTPPLSLFLAFYNRGYDDATSMLISVRCVAVVQISYICMVEGARKIYRSSGWGSEKNGNRWTYVTSLSSFLSFVFFFFFIPAEGRGRRVHVVAL